MSLLYSARLPLRRALERTSPFPRTCPLTSSRHLSTNIETDLASEAWLQPPLSSPYERSSLSGASTSMPTNDHESTTSQATIAGTPPDILQDSSYDESLSSIAMGHSEDVVVSPPRRRKPKPLSRGVVQAKAKELAMFQELRQKRQDMIAQLKNTIRRRYGDQYNVVPFGSTCYGGATGKGAGDVDLAILDDERPYGFEPGCDRRSLPPIYEVRRLAGFLARQGYTNVSFVHSAAVPIVKLTDPVTGISTDLNVNNRLGIYNTALLRLYCLHLPPLAPLIRKIKSWARYVELNASSGTDGKPHSFSSYSLTLMTVAMLQNQGQLPNLQADENTSTNTHYWDLGKDNVHRKINVRFGPCKESLKVDTSSFNALTALRSWFNYWAYTHDYDKGNTVVSIRDGGLVFRTVATNVPPALEPRANGEPSQFGRLVVLDPFLTKNCTQAIAYKTLMEFRTKCRGQYAKLSAIKNNTQLLRRWPTL